MTWENTQVKSEKQDTELYVVLLYNPDYVNK
jgi:hypothetical protein